MKKYHNIINIIAKPAFANKISDPGNYRLYSEIIRSGLQVQEWSLMRIILGNYDIVHIHWPDNILKTRFWWRAMIKLSLLIIVLVWIRRFRRRDVIWTAHNIESHEGWHPRIEKLFWDQLTKHLDGVLVHEIGIGEQLHLLRPQLKTVPMKTIPLAHFKGHYPCDISRQEARERLGIKNDEFVYGFLGQLRPYKNVNSLIKAFLGLPEGNRLIIAGNPIDKAIQESLKKAAQGNKQIELHFEFVEDTDLQVFYKAFDLVVLPFSQITNSGSALLALSFECPVLIAYSPTLLNMQAEFGEQYVSFFKDKLDSATLTESANRIAASKRNPIDLSQREITTVAQQTIQFYRDVLKMS
ncbi:MAG: glycosyltransferase [Paracoccaceae bacterium]